MSANTVPTISVTQLSFSISRTADSFTDAPKIITAGERSIVVRNNTGNDSFTRFSKGINTNRGLGNDYVEASSVTEKPIIVRGKRNSTSTFSKSINTYNPIHFSDNVDYLGANGKITFTGSVQGAFGNNNFGLALRPVFSNITTGVQPVYSYNFSAGASSDLRLPINQGKLALGTGNFTVEAWLFGGLQSLGTFYCTGPWGGNNSAMFLFEGNSVILRNAGGNLGSAVIPTGVWNHVAFVRTSSSVKIYVNGVGGTAFGAGTSFSDVSQVVIGGSAIGPYGFNGSISNLRVIVGEAFYTSNFTPPTRALTATANTQLLTAQSSTFKDNSNNNFILTPGAGGAFVSGFSPYSNTIISLDTAGGQASYTEFDDTKIPFKTELKIPVRNSLIFSPEKTSDSNVRINVVNSNQLPDLKVIKSLGINTGKTLFASPVTSTTSQISIRVKDILTIGFFSQDDGGSFAAISNQNDPRLLYIPGTAVAPDATLVQIWF
jgi:hypothetical protein